MKHIRKIASVFIAAAFIGTSYWSFGSSSNNLLAALRGKTLPADSLMKSPSNPNNSKIKMNEEIHEFGRVEQNSFAETTFIIGNSGTDTLEIFSAQPSCGCTAAMQGKKQIPPGDTSHLFIRFDPHNKAE